jgi:hypothetical protein
MSNLEQVILTTFGLWILSRSIMAACYREWLFEVPTIWDNFTFGVPAPWGVAIGGAALLMGLKILPLPW